MKTLHNEIKPKSQRVPTRKNIPITYLNLHVKHRIRINLQPKRSEDMVRKAFLIALLDLRPLTTERLVFDILEKTLELREVFEPDALIELQRR